MSRIGALKNIAEECARVRLVDTKQELLGVLVDVYEMAQEEIERAKDREGVI